jgi:hypothetical protein
MKKPDRVVLTVLGLAVAAVVSIVATIYFSPRPVAASRLSGPYDNDTCNALAAIATDPQKVRYVRFWFAQRAREPRFIYELNENADFAPPDPRTPELIDLDWSYLGLQPKWKAASFNVGDYGRKPFTADSVKSITLYQGRSEVTIGMSADGDLGFDQSPDGGRTRSFGDNVFVSCGGD